MFLTTSQACVSTERFTVQIGKYTVTRNPDFGWKDIRCECKGFQFRGNCKHVAQAMSQNCGWDSHYDDGEAKDGKCPNCGSDTITVSRKER